MPERKHKKEKNKLTWLRLDNAAKIYPAARSREWSSIFRLSATMNELVDADILQSALDVTVPRFPSIAALLRRGVFWYYLEQLEKAPKVRRDSSYPMTKMSRREVRQCAFRVLVYDKRIALEVFHSLTDGTGAMIFLKTLVAEYLQQRYKITVPAEKGVLDRREKPSAEELEDSFQKFAGAVQEPRHERDSWRVDGTLEPEGFLHVTCLEIPSDAVLEKAHSYGVSVTNFLCAVMMMAIQNLQAERIPERRNRKSVKLLIPVNLRNLFPTKTLRNFAMYIIPEIMPKLGKYSFEEICRIIKGYMLAQINAKYMSTKIATNVSSERILVVKLMPLFIKNLVMKAVFDAVGERKSCLSFSNLGVIQMPEEMLAYVQRLDFVIGIQATAPYNCGALTFKDTLYINFIRNVVEPDLERHYFQVLRELGVPVTVSSNLSSYEKE